MDLNDLLIHFISVSYLGCGFGVSGFDHRPLACRFVSVDL